MDEKSGWKSDKVEEGTMTDKTIEISIAIANKNRAML